MSELARSYRLEVESIGELNAGSCEVSVSSYGTSPYLWFYSEKWNCFKRIPTKKIERGDSRKFISVPTHYKGKRLTKHEALFLLNVHKEWGEYATGSLERIDSLINMHRSASKFLKHKAFRDVLVKGGILTSIPIVFYLMVINGASDFSASTFTTISLGSVSVFLGGAGIVQTSYFFADRYRMTTDVLAEVFMLTKEKFVHDDFREFYDYISGEWANYTSRDQVLMKAVRPSPFGMEEYKERYKASTALENGRMLPGFSLESSQAASNRVALEESSWAAIRGILNNVKQEWFEWELDILKVVQYPALFDMREAATVDFHRALITVDSMKVDPNEAYSVNHPFASAVTNLKLAWTVAKNEAERIQQSHFGAEERRRLAKAMDLLSIALNASGTPSERQASYKRAMKQLEGIVRVPASAVSAIEAGIGLKELEGV